MSRMFLQALQIALDHKYIYMIHVMRKSFCIFEHIGAVIAQLISTSSRNFKPLTIFGDVHPVLRSAEIF